MAQNLASKFAAKVSERLVKESVAKQLTNRNYEWTGVDTIKIYSVDTFPMNDYQRGSDNRYGNPDELGKTLQTWTLEQDRSFTGTIDRLNHDQSMQVTKPGTVLARQVREEVVPEVDTYILSVISEVAATYNRDDIVSDAATDATNAYSNFLTINANIEDNEGKDKGFAVMTAAYYNFLKQGGFVLDSDSAYRDRKTGNLGTVDGRTVVICPSSRMPANTDLIIGHKEVTTFADVLTDYVTHKNPPGINGWLLEGRIAYDAFADVNKVYDLGVHRTA